MKLFKRICTVALAGMIAMSTAACFGGGGGGGGGNATSYNGVDFAGEAFLDLIEEDGEQSLNLAVMYDSNSYMIYNGSSPYDAADGVTYTNLTQSPMLKPVWKTIENNLNIKITNKSGGATDLKGQYDSAYMNSFIDYDILNTNDVVKLNSQGATGSFVDIKPFLNRMPNLKAFLDENPFIFKTIQASGGKMFYAPYFDGYDDLERMFILRADWVRKLLDNGSDVGSTETVTTFNAYTPFLPEQMPAQTVAVTVMNGTTPAASTVSKAAGTNIIKRLEGKNTGKAMIAEMLSYISDRYGNYYGSNPSNLFVGQNASYDVDELVALLRLVKANGPYLTDGVRTVAQMVPFYPRHATNDRVADLLRLASIFGVRGLDGRNGFMYIDENGTLQDARVLPDLYYGIEKLNQMYAEGLILGNFRNPSALGSASGAFQDKEFRGILNRQNRGFMTYDYNQTTTLHNGLDGQESEVGPVAGEGNNVEDVIEGFDLTPVLPPYTVWKGKTYDTNDNLTLPTLSDANFYRFTESWRSVKVDGWGIIANTSGKKLERALAVFDYMYSPEGQKLMSFGPDPWIADSTTGLGGVESDALGTMIYNGREVPKLAPVTLEELKNRALGNYTNYYRRFLGGTMPIGYVKDPAMEYQATHEKGKKGQDIINNAIATGTMSHLVVGAEYSNITDKTLKSVPSVMPYSANEFKAITENYTELDSMFNVSPGINSGNVLYDYIMFGFGTSTSGSLIPTASSNNLTRTAARTKVSVSGAPGSGNLNCTSYLNLNRSAYGRLGV